MRNESYWNLFWLSGMPEAWMMTRPTEGYLFPSAPVGETLSERREPLPKEARQLEQNRSEQAAAESVQRSDYIG